MVWFSKESDKIKDKVDEHDKKITVIEVKLSFYDKVLMGIFMAIILGAISVGWSVLG